MFILDVTRSDVLIHRVVGDFRIDPIATAAALSHKIYSGGSEITGLAANDVVTITKYSNKEPGLSGYFLDTFTIVTNA